MFCVGTIIGIQFMLASAEDKAKVKEALVPYVVGCFVIFGAFTIWSTVVNIGQDIVSTEGPIGTPAETVKAYCTKGPYTLCPKCYGAPKKVTNDRGSSEWWCEKCGSIMAREFDMSIQCTNCKKTFYGNKETINECNLCGVSLKLVASGSYYQKGSWHRCSVCQAETSLEFDDERGYSVRKCSSDYRHIGTVSCNLEIHCGYCKHVFYRTGNISSYNECKNCGISLEFSS